MLAILAPYWGITELFGFWRDPHLYLGRGVQHLFKSHLPDFGLDVALYLFELCPLPHPLKRVWIVLLRLLILFGSNYLVTGIELGYRAVILGFKPLKPSL